MRGKEVLISLNILICFPWLITIVVLYSGGYTNRMEGKKAQKDPNFQVFSELVKNVLHYEEW